MSRNLRTRQAARAKFTRHQDATVPTESDQAETIRLAPMVGIGILSWLALSGFSYPSVTECDPFTLCLTDQLGPGGFVLSMFVMLPVMSVYALAQVFVAALIRRLPTIRSLDGLKQGIVAGAVMPFLLAAGICAYVLTY